MKYSIFKWLIFLFIYIIYFSCNINKSKKSETNNTLNSRCQLLSMDFTIDYSTMKDFEKEIRSYFNDEYYYDILVVFMKGGNHQLSYLHRWYLQEEKSWTMLNIKNGLKTKKVVEEFPKKTIPLINNITNGNFVQVCDYSSNNDTYLYLIKENANIKIKYISSSSTHFELSQKDKNKIKNIIDVFEALEKME